METFKAFLVNFKKETVKDEEEFRKYVRKYGVEN